MIELTTRWFPLLAALALALAPGCPAGDDDDRPGRDDDDAADDDDDDDDDDAVDPETVCDDGLDDDGDGLIDCVDPDCADVFHCTWPDAMEHSARFTFTPYVDWLDPCETRFTALLSHGADDCPAADRTYHGAFQYTVNTCADLLDAAGVDLPANGAYGIVFLSEHEREVFTRDTEGAWGSLGIAAWEAGPGLYLLARDDEMEGIGGLHTELTFVDH